MSEATTFYGWECRDRVCRWVSRMDDFDEQPPVCEHGEMRQVSMVRDGWMDDPDKGASLMFHSRDGNLCCYRSAFGDVVLDLGEMREEFRHGSRSRRAVLVGE